MATSFSWTCLKCVSSFITVCLPLFSPVSAPLLFPSTLFSLFPCSFTSLSRSAFPCSQLMLSSLPTLAEYLSYSLTGLFLGSCLAADETFNSCLLARLSVWSFGCLFICWCCFVGLLVFTLGSHGSPRWSQNMSYFLLRLAGSTCLRGKSKASVFQPCKPQRLS